MLRLRTFGQLQVQADGQPTHLGRQREAALLVYVACSSRPLARGHLVGVFWPRSTPSHGHHSLSQAIYRLTKALPGLSFQATPTFVSVDVRALSTDVADFRRCLASGELATAREIFSRGLFLEGLALDGAPDFDIWVDATRRELNISAEDMFRRILQSSEASGDWDSALDAARQILQLDPYDENAAATTVGILLTRGDQASARAQLVATMEELRAVDRSPSRRLLDLKNALEGDLEEYDGGHDLPLIGREPEFLRLRDMLGQVQSGRVGSVLITGKAGIGKSRLVHQMAKLAAIRGFRVLATTGAPLVSEIAHSGTREILSGISHAEARRLVPAWTDVLGGILPGTYERSAATGHMLPPPQERLYEAVAALLQAYSGETPILIVADDLQWVDEPTVDLLRFLLRRTRSSRIFVVASGRLHEIRGEARMGLATEVSNLELRELSFEAAHDIVAAFCTRESKVMREAEAEALVRRSGGHPFFVLELLLAWAARSASPGDRQHTASGSIEQFLDARLNSLSALARSCAEVLAVLGGSGSAQVIASVLDVEEESVGGAVEELVRSGWIRDDTEPQFIHDLVREAAYGAMTQTRRRMLHARTARSLQTSSNVDVCALAVHADIGNAHDLAYRCAVAAAKKMERTLGHGAAETYWRQALSHARGNFRRLRATERLANCCFLAHQQSDADQFYAELQNHRLVPALRLTCDARRVRIAAESGRLADAEKACNRLVAAAAVEPDQKSRLEVARAVAFVTAVLQPSLFFRFGAFLRAVAVESPPLPGTYNLLEVLSELACYHPQAGDAKQYLELAARATIGGRPDDIAQLHCLRGMLEIVGGSPVMAEREYMRAVSLVGGEPARLTAVCRANLSIVWLELGKPKEAEAALVDCVRWAEATHAVYDLMQFESNLSLVHYEAGSRDLALRSAARAVALAENWPEPAIHTLPFGLLGLLSMTSDQLRADECREALLRIDFEHLPAGTDASYSQIFLARMDEREGETAKALDRIDSVIVGVGGRDRLARGRLELEKARLLGSTDVTGSLALARHVRANAIEGGAVLLLNNAESVIRALRSRQRLAVPG